MVTIHDAVPWTHPDTLTPRGVRWHRAMAERAAGHADAIVVPTRAVADELERHLTLRSPVTVTGLGVSGRLALPADAGERARRLGLPEGPFLLSLATLEPRKGLDVLVDALARPEAPDVPLLLVGQAGWGDVDPEAFAAGAGLTAGRVRPLGRLSDTDLAVVLDRATALVVPSRAEGFGLPVLEAMAAGTAVVTSDAPALVEVGGGATSVTPVGIPPPWPPHWTGSSRTPRSGGPSRTPDGAGRSTTRGPPRPTGCGGCTTSCDPAGIPAVRMVGSSDPLTSRRPAMGGAAQPRVLVDATAVPANRGGVGRYVDQLLPALEQAGAALAVVCQAHDVEHYGALLPGGRPGGRAGRRSHRTAARFAWEQTGLPRWSRRERAPQVLHSPHYTLPLGPGSPS